MPRRKVIRQGERHGGTRADFARSRLSLYDQWMGSSRSTSKTHPTQTSGDETQPPWWERLDDDFYRSPESFDMDRLDLARAKLAATPDVAIRTLGAYAVATMAMPFGYHPGRLRKLAEDQHIYTKAPECGDPTAFFRTPAAGVRITRHRPGLPYFRPRRGRCFDLQFQSPYQPVNPREREAYGKHRRNRIAHARYWRHEGDARPTLIAIHGFSADPYWLNEWFFELPRYFNMGCDVLLVTLPFHGRRKGRLAPFSGHGFFAGGISRMNEAFGQAIFDLRIFLDFLLEDQGAPSVGATGISLGGYTAALLAAVDERLSFAIPNVPLVSIADLVMEWHPISMATRGIMGALKLSLADIRKLVAVHSPLSYPVKLPKERLLIIGGVGDRMAPPKHARLLWEHWDKPDIHWFAGSHLVHLGRDAYHSRMRSFLREINFLD